jgi:MFS family permease
MHQGRHARRMATLHFLFAILKNRFQNIIHCAMQAFLSVIFKHNEIPKEYRANFFHLYLDIGWFGLLSGSAVNFINIYATRLGATGFQIGMIGAVSAAVSLLAAIPAGRWIEKRNTGRAVFWASVVYRIGFFLWIPLPWLFNNQAQIWALILLTFLMAIPLTPLAVGFSALFAEAVPSDWRAHVAALRNIVLSVTFMAASLLSGYILKNVTFPLGYQIVFGIGALGAAMSSLHLYFIRPLPTDPHALPTKPEPDLGKQSVSPLQSLRLDIWKTRFRNVLLGLFAFHFSQYLAIPIFPIYNVRILKLNDSNIGIGTALFYLTVLLGSTQLRRIVHRIGHKNLTGWSVASMAAYPLILAASTHVWQFYVVSLIGGLSFSMVSGAYANYMLEHIPANDRPTHLAWYDIILNAAVLIGSLSGPALADQIGLSQALVIIAALRFLAGWAILKWG